MAYLNPNTLLKLLPYLRESEFSIQEVTYSTGIPDKTIVEVLSPLIEQNYLEVDKDKVLVHKGSVPIFSLQTLKAGASFNEILKLVRWQDFEDFVHTVVSEYGFTSFKNYRVKKPRAEIDVLALKGSFGLVIDCKQWHKVLEGSDLDRVVAKQISRAKVLLAIDKNLLKGKVLVPVIVTLLPSSERYYYGVPIVPCEMFKSFVGEIDGRLSEVLTISMESV